MAPITFDENNFQVWDFPHTDPFIVTTNIAEFTVHNILIDNGSSADILFIKPFEQMSLDKWMLKPAGNSLFGFGRKILFGEEGNTGLFCRRKKGPHRDDNFWHSQHGLSVYCNLRQRSSKQVQNCSKAKVPMHEDDVPFWVDCGTWRLGRIQANRGKANLGLQPHKWSDQEAAYQRHKQWKGSRSKGATYRRHNKKPLLKLVLEKCVHIGSGLNKDEKDGLITFLHETRMYSHGRRKICKVSVAILLSIT